MANAVLAGFEPIGMSSGGGTVTHHRRRVISNQTTAIFKGDAVIGVSDGTVAVATSTTSVIKGVARGASYVGSAGRIERMYLPATTVYSGTTFDTDQASYVYVCGEDYNVDFRASVPTSAIVLTNIGNTAAMVLGAGSTTTGLSAHTLASSGLGTTTTYPWFITGVVQDEADHDPDLVNGHAICQMNTTTTLQYIV